MTNLSLVLSERFSTQDAHTLRETLTAHLKVGEPQWLVRKSADPGLSSIIEIIGSATSWFPLKAAATVFLSTLAKHVGDATWNSLRSLFKSNEVKPLADVATALVETANKVEGRVEIVLGINVPDEFRGTCISIKAGEPEEIARRLAALVVRIEKVSEVMQEEIDAGREPLGGAVVEVQDDGSLLIRWHSERRL